VATTEAWRDRSGDGEHRATTAPRVIEQQVREPNLNVHAPPWRHNPSSWSQRIPIAVLAMVGFVISTYLALFQWKLVDTVWDPWFGDGSRQVLESELSQQMHRWMLIPDAALGALAYLGDALFGMAGSTRRWQYRPWMVLLFGLDVIPLGIVSAILIMAQGAVVGAWCFLCLVTAVISLVLVPLAFDEVWSTIRYLHRVWKRSRSGKVLWNTFIGRPSRIAEEVALEVRGG